ncbi:MAG: ABC transporter substrate-binding protein [Xanthobacteraceae bacterium]
MRCQWCARYVLGAAAAVFAFALAPGAARAQPLGSPKLQQLYETARKEGRVMIWGTQRREVEWIPAAFSMAFPGIEVEFLGDNDIAVKAIAEARSGRHQLDVYQSSLTGTLPVVQRDLLAVVDWSPFAIDARNVAFDGKMALTSNIVYTIAYNKRLVKEADAPTTWASILEQRYRGKGAASAFLLPRLIGGLGLAWGEEKALQFARDIVATMELLLTRAPRESLLQSGERQYAFAEIDSLIRSVAAEGLPVGQVVPEPVVVGQFGVSILKNASHPNAARLLAGFLATPEGKAARLKATSQADYGPTADNAFAKLLHSGKLQVVWDRPDNMAQREALFGRAAAILTGQAR